MSAMWGNGAQLENHMHGFLRRCVQTGIALAIVVLASVVIATGIVALLVAAAGLKGYRGVQALVVRFARPPRVAFPLHGSTSISRLAPAYVPAVWQGNVESDLDIARRARLSGVDELQIDDYAMWSERVK